MSPVNRLSKLCFGVPRLGMGRREGTRDSDAKQQQLEGYRVTRATGYLTTQQGVRVDHTDDSLTYKHLKAVAAFGAGIELLRKAGIDEPLAMAKTPSLTSSSRTSRRRWPSIGPGSVKPIPSRPEAGNLVARGKRHGCRRSVSSVPSESE
jgi:hypothetical protein